MNCEDIELPGFSRGVASTGLGEYQHLLANGKTIKNTSRAF
jgi:hypothetical protein